MDALQVILITATEGLRVNEKEDEESTRKVVWLPSENSSKVRIMISETYNFKANLHNWYKCILNLKCINYEVYKLPMI